MAINWERLIAEANTDKYENSPLLLANTELLDGNLNNFRLLFLLATSIQNGIGLTRACQNIGLSIVKLTEWFTLRPELKEYFYSRRQKGYYLIVNKANFDASEMNIREWQTFNNNAAKFNPNLVLWEEYVTKAEITPESLLNAFRIYYRDEFDVATSVGFTHKEYIEYVTSNPALQFCISEELKFLMKNKQK